MPMLFLRRPACGLAFCLAALVSITAADAQHPDRPVLRALRPAARAHVVTTDSLHGLETRPVPQGRIDVRSGVWRAAYRLETARPADGTSTEAAVRAYLEEAAAQFGWRGRAEDLVVTRVVETPRSRHVTLQQTFYGVPVHGRQVQVNLDAAGRPTMVVSGYAPHLQDVRGFDPVPALAASTARLTTTALAEGPAEASDPELVVVPTDAPRLAWRIVLWPTAVAAEFEVLLDAHTGAVVQIVETSMHRAKGERRTAHGKPGEA